MTIVVYGKDRSLDQVDPPRRPHRFVLELAGAVAVAIAAYVLARGGLP